ncbi:MAG TPA: CYTH domain-containing protein [Salinimicrobium sp.]|nr:CYTH domain-containing protein [Salinimicrobium sp.]
MTEIERKFLVTSEGFKSEAFSKTKIIQAYLNSHQERTVRVRTKEEEAFITIKGKSNDSGLTRFEWEKKIDFKDALELLKLAEPGKIEKFRYEIRVGDHIFEVDEFLGDNAGLTIAEIELKSEEEYFEKPEWLGKEVSGDKRYYNSFLSKNPYKNW